MSDDFEKYWQQQFESFEVQPNNNLWHKLDNALFEKQSQSIFKQYVVSPSSRVWRNIVMALWWKKFVRFSPTYFNIYYFFSSILFAGGIILFYQSNHHSFSKKFSNSYSENTINTPRDIISRMTKQEHYEIKQSFINQQNRIVANDAIPANNFGNYEKDNKNTEQLAFLQLRRNILYSNDITENFSDREVKEYKKKTNVNLGFSLAAAWPQHQLKLSQSIEKQHDPYFELLSTKAFSAALWYQGMFNLFDFETGLIFQSIKQTYSYNNPIISNDTIVNMQINDLSYYQYSTIQIINLDTLLLTGDTVWINYIDSTLITVYDTTFQTTIQEKRTDHRSTHYFSYKTVEIPFMIGYTYQLERFNVLFKTGVSLVYIIATNGTIPSFTESYGNVPLQNNYFKAFYLNSLIAIETQYWLNERWSLSIMPMYKRTLTSITHSNIPISLKANSWGIFLNLKYRIR